MKPALNWRYEIQKKIHITFNNLTKGFYTHSLLVFLQISNLSVLANIFTSTFQGLFLSKLSLMHLTDLCNAFDQFEICRGTKYVILFVCFVKIIHFLTFYNLHYKNEQIINI